MTPHAYHIPGRKLQLTKNEAWTLKARASGLSFEDMGIKLGCSKQSAHQTYGNAVKKSKALETAKKDKNSLHSLGLLLSRISILNRMGVHTVTQLIKNHTPQSLADLRYFGWPAVKLIQKELKRRGVKW